MTFTMYYKILEKKGKQNFKMLPLTIGNNENKFSPANICWLHVGYIAVNKMGTWVPLS